MGRAGAAEFFCGREGGGPDTLRCLRAEARWRDVQRWSVFVDRLIGGLEGIYADPALDLEGKLAARDALWETERRSFEAEVAPELEALRFGGLMSEPPNNAVLLGQMRYYHRIPDFAALLERQGSLRSAIEALKRGMETVQDPWELLPGGA